MEWVAEALNYNFYTYWPRGRIDSQYPSLVVRAPIPNGYNTYPCHHMVSKREVKFSCKGFLERMGQHAS